MVDNTSIYAFYLYYFCYILRCNYIYNKYYMQIIINNLFNKIKMIEIIIFFININ